MPENSNNENKLINLANIYIKNYANINIHTTRAKKLDLKHFIHFLSNQINKKNNDLLTSDFTPQNINLFIEEKLSLGEAPTTVARRIATIKHFAKTVSENNKNFINPTTSIKAPKRKIEKPDFLDRDEINKILQNGFEKVISKKSFKNIRNFTIFSLLLDTGIRADEIKNLLYSQLDSEYSWLKNVRTKGRKFRNVYITTAIKNILITYIEIRELELKKLDTNIPINIKKNLPLFISLYKAEIANPKTLKMGSKSIYRAVNEFSIDTKLHPHLLRHSYATELLNETKDIRLVAQALGHSDVRVTMRYTSRSDKDLSIALEKTRKNQKINT